MTKARLMDQPADYKKWGVNPNEIETWEDGRRNKDTGKGNWEWWYFDSIMDDGINANGDSPSITLKVTLPSGETYDTTIEVPAEKATYGEGKCDVHFGDSAFVGDFKDYQVKVAEHDGLAIDLHLTSKSKPYRPGTAYFEFGDKYFTWLCSVPQGEVEGTVLVKGKELKVHGTGYHDHQWGSEFYLPEWNHWVWARQAFDDYTLLVFDFVTAEQYGYERIPIAFVQDKEGNLVFESHDKVDCEVLDSFVEEKYSGKEYPAHIHYVFHDGDKTLDYDLKRKQTLEAQGMKSIPWVGRLLVKRLKLDVAYSRFLADGKLTLTGPDGEVKRDGELIFEFMYPGKTYKGLM